MLVRIHNYGDKRDIKYGVTAIDFAKGFADFSSDHELKYHDA
jgi:hypothetical protein